MPDVKFVKSLIDGYDLGRSEAANYMDEVKNLIFVLKGYGGQNLSDFIKQLNEDRAILIDDAEDGASIRLRHKWILLHCESTTSS
mgnify:FL=1